MKVELLIPRKCQTGKYRALLVDGVQVAEEWWCDDDYGGDALSSLDDILHVLEHLGVAVEERLMDPPAGLVQLRRRSRQTFEDFAARMAEYSHALPGLHAQLTNIGVDFRNAGVAEVNARGVQIPIALKDAGFVKHGRGFGFKREDADALVDSE